MALEKARASGVLSSEERAECAFYLGAAYVAVGSEGAARRELASLLEAQPTFEPPPYTSPKVASLLGEVARERGQAPQLEPRPPRRLPADGATLSTEIELGFETRRTRPPVYGVVRYRMRGERAFREAPLVAHGVPGDVTAEATIALSARVQVKGGGVLEYYADALGGGGALHAASAALPLELPVPKDDRVVSTAPAKRDRSKLVWLAVPVGVVAGIVVGVGVYYGLRSR